MHNNKEDKIIVKRLPEGSLNNASTPYRGMPTSKGAFATASKKEASLSAAK